MHEEQREQLKEDFNNLNNAQPWWLHKISIQGKVGPTHSVSSNKAQTWTNVKKRRVEVNWYMIEASTTVIVYKESSFAAFQAALPVLLSDSVINYT